MNYLYLDIETCPIDKELYDSLEDEEAKLKLLNPIDSRVVAIGMKYSDSKDAIILQNSDEKKLLEEMWQTISKLRGNGTSLRIVGFNILNFDMPFIIARCFINKVSVLPISGNEIIDLRDLVSFFRTGKTRGGLKDFGKTMGIELDENDGSKIAGLCFQEDKEDGRRQIAKYLHKDIELTESMHKQIIELGIDKLRRY